MQKIKEIPAGRREEIENLFYDTLLRTPYASISVMDMCRQIGISRTAFYKHYPSKEACIVDVIDKHTRIALLRAVDHTSDSQGYAVAYLDFWKQNRAFLDVIVRDQLERTFFNAHIHFFQEESRHTMRRLDSAWGKADSDVLACCVACFVTTLMQWHSRNFDTPTEEMAKKLRRVMLMPLLQSK